MLRKMNKSERFKILLETGYFPEELPPPFHTADLARYRNVVAAAWGGLANYPNSTSEIYSSARLGTLRRNLAIVNPTAEFRLLQLISDEWIELRKHLRKSRYCLEIPEIESDRERAVSPPDFALIAVRRIDIAASFDHAPLADISRFYGTLYTHAIPWALSGKEWCKRNLHNAAYNASLGNRLDVAVRKGQGNQTIGIPIGPDSSRILAEIVGAAVDLKVQKSLGLTSKRAFRSIDDWYIGFDSAGEAEDAVATIAAACRDFELELNAEKTRTIHASAAIEGLWPTELRGHRFPVSAVERTKALEHFFAKAFRFANEHRGQNILNYAIKRTRGLVISKTDWRLYESYVLKASRSSSSVIPTVAQILVSYNHMGYAIDKDRVSKLIEDLVRKNAPLGHHAEIAWALFLAKALRITVSRKAARSVTDLEHSVCALLMLDLRENGLVQGALDTSLWRLSMTPQGLTSHMWLLAYEADLKGWLHGTPRNFVDADPHFSVLKGRRIPFYDIHKNVKHVKKEKPPRRSSGFEAFVRELRMPAVLEEASFLTYD